MARLFVLGALAIALLAVGSIVLIEVMTDSDGERAAPASPPAAQPMPLAEAVVPEPAPAFVAPRVPVPTDAPPVTAVEPSIGSPPDLGHSGSTGSVSEANVARKRRWVSVAVRPRDLRTLWIEIANQRPELPRCWAEEPRAAVPQTRRGKQPLPKPAELILVLENDGEMVRVADTQVGTQGDDRAATIACARAMLKDVAFAVPASISESALDAGTRAEIRYVLQ
jgi:hypothetical protein